MDAFAIKGPDGAILHVEPEESEEYTWEQFNESSSDAPGRKYWESKGYRCVPVQITEGWIPVDIIKDEMSKDDGAALHYADLSVHLPIGTKLYAEPPPPQKERK